MEFIVSTKQAVAPELLLWRKRTSDVVLGVILLIAAVRAVCEWSMMAAHGSDPQMGIWYAEMLIKILFWLLTGFIPLWLFRSTQYKRRGLLTAAIVLSIWIAAISWASWNYQRGGQALTDAANPATSPQQLTALLRFNGIQAGYELDNRLAKNPHTPVDSLRKLHGKRDQVGTEMSLARNPNTPSDILETLAKSNDEWILRSLAQNLKLPIAIREQLPGCRRNITFSHFRPCLIGIRSLQFR